MKIAIITENSLSSGAGHYIRQRRIQNKLLELNYEVKIFNLSELSRESIYKSINRHELLLIDVPFKRQDLLPKFKVQTIGFDWIGVAKPNVNIVTYKQPKFAYTFSDQIYFGLKFFSLTLDSKINSKYGDYHLISLGKSAKFVTYQNIIHYIRTKFGNDLQILICHGLKSFPKIYDKNIEVLNFNNNFLNLVSQSKFNYVNGGGTLLESLILRKPTISFPQNELEQNFVIYLHKRGFRFFSNMKKSYNKFNGLKRLRNNIVDPLDGLGANRICKIIGAMSG